MLYQIESLMVHSSNKVLSIIESLLNVQTIIIYIFSENSETTLFGYLLSLLSNTPKYHKKYTTPPVETAKLTGKRKFSRMKSIILGRKVWDSLTSKFQAEIIMDTSEFEREDKHDGVLLWECL